jgi:hypothetical protein
MYPLRKLLSGADLVLVLGLAVVTVPVFLLTPIRGVWSRTEPPAAQPQTEPPAAQPQTEPPAAHSQNSSDTFSPLISFPDRKSTPYMCPEPGVLDVHAIADLDNHEGGQSHIFYWRLRVLRTSPETLRRETVWEKRYDEKWFECRPGTHTRPEFIQKLMMPKGVYLVHVLLVDCGWELGPTGRHLAEKSSIPARRLWALVR